MNMAAIMDLLPPVILLLLFAFYCLTEWLSPSPEAEAKRGHDNAVRFMESNPSKEAFDEMWSNACVDESFDRSDRGIAYTKAFKAVLRPYRETYS